MPQRSEKGRFPRFRQTDDHYGLFVHTGSSASSIGRNQAKTRPTGGGAAHKVGETFGRSNQNVSRSAMPSPRRMPSVLGDAAIRNDRTVEKLANCLDMVACNPAKSASTVWLRGEAAIRSIFVNTSARRVP